MSAEAGCEFAETYSLEFFAVFALGALGRLELASEISKPRGNAFVSCRGVFSRAD